MGKHPQAVLNELSMFTDYKTPLTSRLHLGHGLCFFFRCPAFFLKKCRLRLGHIRQSLLGALAGLSMVFYHQAAAIQAELGTYCQLASYDDQTPFTLPAYLLANVLAALTTYPQRYADLAQHLHTVLNHPCCKLTSYTPNTIPLPSATCCLLHGDKMPL